MRIIQILESASVGGMGTGSVATAPSKAGKMIKRQDNILAAEGVAETVPMWDAQKVLNHYGADYFKTTYDTLYFYKFRKQFSLNLIRSDDPADAGSVNLSDLNAMVRKLRDMRKSLPYKEGVAEGELDEACWKDYKQIGMKKKGGKQVPNCVPKEGIEKSVEENKKGVRAVKHTVKPRNFVAKNAVQSGAGAHKDKKKAQKQGDVKHKAKEPAYESRLWAALDRRIIK